MHARRQIEAICRRAHVRSHGRAGRLIGFGLSRILSGIRLLANISRTMLRGRMHRSCSRLGIGATSPTARKRFSPIRKRRCARSATRWAADGSKGSQTDAPLGKLISGLSKGLGKSDGETSRDGGGIAEDCRRRSAGRAAARRRNPNGPLPIPMWRGQDPNRRLSKISSAARANFYKICCGAKRNFLLSRL
jgi:hypothetical protein